MRRRTFLSATLAAVSLAVSGASLGLRAALADLCSKVKPRQRAMKLPPLPKWNKLTDDIDGADFVRRSQDYARSLLPRGIVFPRPGQIWEAVRDCEVHFQAWCTVRGSNAWPPQPVASSIMTCQATYTGGRVRLPQGERVRICALEDANRPLHVTFVPLRYQELHPLIVPEDHRGTSSHYVLTLSTAYTACSSRDETGFFRELFRLLDDVAS
jgi:hypothetical protein